MKTVELDEGWTLGAGAAVTCKYSAFLRFSFPISPFLVLPVPTLHLVLPFTGEYTDKMSVYYNSVFTSKNIVSSELAYLEKRRQVVCCLLGGDRRWQRSQTRQKEQNNVFTPVGSAITRVGKLL